MKILRNSILYVWAAGIGMAQVGADSGWAFQNPQPTGSNLRAVAALNGKTMVAVGEQGVILRTTDTGVTWQRLSSGISAELSQGDRVLLMGIGSGLNASVSEIVW